MSSKKASKPEKPLTKTAFVRSLPSDMPAKDVIEKAKDKGLKLTEAYVYEIRSTANRGSKKKKSAAKKGKAAPRAASKAGGTKRAFVESLPSSTPASEVVRLAKAKGIDLSVNYVYVIRSSRSGGGGSKGGSTRAAASHVSTSGAEGRFVDLVAEIGLGRAEALLSGFRASLRAIRVH